MNLLSITVPAFLILALFHLSHGEDLECPGTVCKGEHGDGCCVKLGLECCPDGLYCVKDAASQCTDGGSPPKPYAPAPEDPAKVLSTARKLLSLKATPCPGGTCEEDNWFCCNDNQYCAETENDCPNFLDSTKKLSMNTKYTQLTKTDCPGGTCEEDGWFCCNDNQYCAETEADCPNFKLELDFLPLM